MSGEVQQFGSISLGSRSGTLQGQLRVAASGFLWKKTGGGGGKTVDIKAGDIDRIIWTKVSRGCQLGVKRKDGSTTNFIGFRDKARFDCLLLLACSRCELRPLLPAYTAAQDSDLENLQEATRASGKEIEVKQMSTVGRNWGDAVIDGSTLVFNVDGKPAFRFPLSDVGQVQKGRDDVMLEFPHDDTGGDQEDALFEMSFFVPKENDRYAVTEGEATQEPLQRFHDEVVQHTDAGAAMGNAVVTFDQVHVLAPRGRFEVEMYLSSLKLTGQAQDYRIQYDSIVRLFVLPKANTPQTLVVVSLDPPIRKGQTYYPHILCQFSNDEELSVELELTEEQLAAKNERCGGKLQTSMSGPAYDVFAKALRGLGAAKLTKPGNFRTADGHGLAVRCSYKADDGYLYPLERAFFYVQKPPTLLVHDEIDSVEFLRQGGVGIGTGKTFDLSIRMRQDQEYQFRGIEKSEWNNLFSFIQAKRLRIENVDEAKQGPAGPNRAAALLEDLGDDGEIDPGTAKLQATGGMDDLSEEDEDFAMKSEEDDGGEPSEPDSEEDAEGGGSAQKSEQPTKKSKPRPASASTEDGSKPAKKKAKAAPAGKDGAKAKPKRAKKAKDAPKGALSAFMWFSNEKRPQVKEQFPDIAFGEVGKKLGEMWKAVDPEDKKRFEAMAARDKERAKTEMAAYKANKEQAGSAAASPAAVDDDDAADMSD
eukprot:jgi/Astpho2/7691/Aster-02572